MNRFKRFMNSTLRRNLGLASMTVIAIAYTVPRVGSDTKMIETTLFPAVVSIPENTPGWDLANLDNSLVDSWVKIFSTNPKVKLRFALWLDRKPTYEAMISAKLEERAMPQDLIYLAMIESGFNPNAKSPAKAGGLWQFVSETGKRYGLTVNKKVDERNHPDKATDAALSYLSDLHDRFGSWYLAAAAYNTGENRVGRIMREVTGSEKGTDADYYRIASRLPRETQDYVPMIIAAGRISKNPQLYGFGVGSIAPSPFLTQTVLADDPASQAAARTESHSSASRP